MWQDLTKGEKRALRTAAELAHGRDRTMAREDRDVHYLEARNDDLPLIVGAAVAQGLLTIEEVAEVARERVAHVAGALREIREERATRVPEETDEDEEYDATSPVSVAAIVREIDSLRDETTLYVNRRTGEVRVMDHECLPGRGRSPAGSAERVPLFLQPAAVDLFAETAVGAASANRTSFALFVALSATFAGGLIGALGVAHTSAVVSLERASRLQFVYTFRLYSLVLFGVLLIVLGLTAAVEAGRLPQGRRAVWRRSVFVWAAILAINLPLVPLQGFAILFSALAGFELLLLFITGRHFNLEPDDQ
ncbi:MAG TPA: hypothetical protein VF701_19065 [Thermoanaerobaculia bacterium]